MLVKKLLGKTGVFNSIVLYRQYFNIILQKACGKFEFLSNNFSAKRLIFPYYYRQIIFKKIDCGSKQFVKHLTAKIKILSDI
jgi:hypothetical protein